ncbi:hypothetical protein TOPH_01673 [Tolypocladium ophioglossoides CBS 100239]|uniref:Uncharacterized protein n=1 Tax=Tolypocladium ophioglossoides (strain CBS 100239) TaxID=1163406 RepID=A0A0L0NI84_TOLOC|nr:hypothetical protein TOPH_01673 [Tolypocladium ophioglossoides CBS 100239]
MSVLHFPKRCRRSGSERSRASPAETCARPIPYTFPKRTSKSSASGLKWAARLRERSCAYGTGAVPATTMRIAAGVGWQVSCRLGACALCLSLEHDKTPRAAMRLAAARGDTMVCLSRPVTEDLQVLVCSRILGEEAVNAQISKMASHLP